MALLPDRSRYLSNLPICYGQIVLRLTALQAFQVDVDGADVSSCVNSMPCVSILYMVIT